MSRAAVLCGLGAWVPPTVVDNDQLARDLDTSDEWIRTRTGIARRRIAGPGLATSDLAAEAGRRALESARRTAAGAGAPGPQVDLVVLATSTPDQPCPATAPQVAHRLGLGTVAAFDVAAVCTGFIYALATAASMVVAGCARSALVIGADTFSTILDPADRTTRAIFGDGAGAVVLRAGEDTEPGALLAFDLHSDGAGHELITVPGGGARERSLRTDNEAVWNRYFTMQGRAVFTEAVVHMSDSVRTVLDRTGWSSAQLDRLVAHQANLRILRAVGGQLDLDDRQVVTNLDEVGNTVAASIPLALADAASDGNLRPGHRVALTGFGGGVTWGSAALTWPRLALAADAPEPEGTRLTEEAAHFTEEGAHFTERTDRTDDKENLS
ncbi:beta-ketoacyl-ACP synthase III [Streptomyces sp. NPDC102340]|uniref:beta-ketoacyl-ACP synthase III n=1 Tax=unclassified Streptomyces TaxID=2593676 RepID=UPI00380BFA62